MLSKRATISIINIMTGPSATMTRIERPPPAWWLWLSGRAPHSYAVILWLLSLFLFRGTLTSLASLSFHDELASHILLIPVISAFLIYLERKRIFRTPRYCPLIGVPMLLVAV